VRRLVGALHPRRIYLFGSRARGDHRADSGYDVLLLVEAERERLHDLEISGRGALRGVGASVDVLVMPPGYFDGRATLVTSLPAVVLREGALLYAS